MVRTAKKAGRPRASDPQYFMIEMKVWEPSYSLSVNHDKYRETAYRQRREFAARHTETTVSRSQRCAGSASSRGCHIAETTISGV